MSTKDEYLYMDIDDNFWRLNITKLEEESSPPDFELVFDFNRRFRELPIGMRCICVVGSRLYMVGRVIHQGIPVDDDSGDYGFLPNLDVLPWIWIRMLHLFASAMIFPKMLGPKSDLLVVPNGKKTYVLSRPSCFKYHEVLPPPIFEVFDTTNGLWRDLPNPPWTEPNYDETYAAIFYHHFTLANNCALYTVGAFVHF